MTGSTHPAARVVLYVPVRHRASGSVVRLFCTPLGAPTAVGFTTTDRLADVLGADQSWIRLAEPALRRMVGPVGVFRVVVDPTLVAASPLAVTPVVVPPAQLPVQLVSRPAPRVSA